MKEIKPRKEYTIRIEVVLNFGKKIIAKNETEAKKIARAEIAQICGRNARNLGITNWYFQSIETEEGRR